MLRLATINIKSLVDRSTELTETVGRKVNEVVALQEVHYGNKYLKILRGSDFVYR